MTEQKDTAAALTHVDDANVHAESFAGEVGNISHVVTKIPDGGQPVPDCSPDGCPGHKLGIDRDIVQLDDIVDSVIEQRDQAGDTNNSQGLCAHDTEHHRR